MLGKVAGRSSPRPSRSAGVMPSESDKLWCHLISTLCAASARRNQVGLQCDVYRHDCRREAFQLHMGLPGAAVAERSAAEFACL